MPSLAPKCSCVLTHACARLLRRAHYTRQVLRTANGPPPVWRGITSRTQYPVWRDAVMQVLCHPFSDVLAGASWYTSVWHGCPGYSLATTHTCSLLASTTSSWPLVGISSPGIPASFLWRTIPSPDLELTPRLCSC